MAKPNSAERRFVANLAPAVDQIFHDAGEPDIPVMVNRLTDLPATAEALGNVALHNLANLDLQGSFSFAAVRV